MWVKKINPHSMRVGVIKDWDSRWFPETEPVIQKSVSSKTDRVRNKKTRKHRKTKKH